MTESIEGRRKIERKGEGEQKINYLLGKGRKKGKEKRGRVEGGEVLYSCHH
tara:strand:+ start:846 stop:998 length:153 start_codon:yes stop_codon:yes gene_type:complete